MQYVPSCIDALLLGAVIIKDVSIVSAAVWQEGSTEVEAGWGWCKNKRAKVLRLMSADFQSQVTSFFFPPFNLMHNVQTYNLNCDSSLIATASKVTAVTDFYFFIFFVKGQDDLKTAVFIYLPFFHHQWSDSWPDVHPWRCRLPEQMETELKCNSNTKQYIILNVKGVLLWNLPSVQLSIYCWKLPLKKTAVKQLTRN